MNNQETKITPVNTTEESISKLQKYYDILYAKYVQLLDELEEQNQLTDSGSGKEVVAYNAEVTCDATHPGYVYFRLDDEMVKVNNIYVDVYPTDYRSPITL